MTAKSRRRSWRKWARSGERPSLEDLVNLGDSTPGPDFAALAPAINELAEAGDPVALGVLQQAAATWWSLSCWCAPSCAASTASPARFPVAWTGGVVEKMTMVREAFFAGLQAAAPQMPVGPGVCGVA